MRRAHSGEVSTLSDSVVVSGTYDPAFQAVHDAFVSNFHLNDTPEIGASLCVIVDGRIRVDLWGGRATETSKWTADTLVNSFSVGKGVTSLLAAHLVSRGILDYDDKVIRWWPQFAPHGKDDLTVRDLLGHRAGLPAIRGPLGNDAMYDWAQITAELAAEEPWWEPGAAHGYHVNTFGFLVGEVLRRATGLDVGTLLRTRLADPFSADAYFGVPRDQHHRIADLVWHSGPSTVSDETPLMQRHAYSNPPGFSGVGEVNTPRWREAILPSTNLHASARGIAAVFSSLLPAGKGDVPFVDPDTISRATTEVSCGVDAVLGAETRFGMGFQIPLAGRGFGPSPRAFGHYGAGGACGFVDPDAAVAFGYTMNQMGRGWQNTRNQALISAVFACL